MNNSRSFGVRGRIGPCFPTWLLSRATARSRLYQVELLVLDELGFLPFDRAGGELLFNLLTERYERRSVIVNTNLAFGVHGARTPCTAQATRSHARLPCPYWKWEQARKSFNA